MSDLLIVVLTILYLLIGMQMGGRMFYWSISIRKTTGAFVVPLIMVPLLWPIVLLLTAIPDSGIRNALWKWDN